VQCFRYPCSCKRRKWFVVCHSVLSLFKCLSQVDDFPCGTCGKSTLQGNCAVTLTTNRGTLKIASTCPEFSLITYSSALKGSKTTPCTNVPVVCELCVQPTNSNVIPGVWRYNLNAHVKALHPGRTQPSQFSSNFLKLLVIDDDEHLAMGIPKEQIPPIFASNPIVSRGVKRHALTELPSPRNNKSARSV
jgi:hypothetical protein